jgi:chromatin-remodeling ATPase INO80
MVISGGGVKPDSLKPTEVVSLLLDDEEIELKYRQKQAERKNGDEKKPFSSTNIKVMTYFSFSILKN